MRSSPTLYFELNFVMTNKVDTVQFSIVDGLITNNGELDSGYYGLTVSVQDVNGNVVSDTFYVYVLPSNMFTTSPTTPTTPPEPSGLGPMFLIVGGIVGAAVVILLFVFLQKKKTP